jgi:hypothetical protein
MEPSVIAGKVNTKFLDQQMGNYQPEVSEEVLSLIEAYELTGLAGVSSKASATGAGGVDSRTLWGQVRL